MKAKHIWYLLIFIVLVAAMDLLFRFLFGFMTVFGI